MSRRRTLLVAVWAAWLLGLTALVVAGQGEVALYIAPVALMLALPLSGCFVGAEHVVRRLARARTWRRRPVSSRRPVPLVRVVASVVLCGPRCLRGPPAVPAPAR